MSTLLGWVAGNRGRAYGIAVVVVSWLALTPVPDLISSGILTILGILLGTDLHNAVVTVPHAVAATRAAAVEAATSVAEQVNSHTAGPIGAITEEAAAVAATAADDAADDALRTLGVKRKDRGA